jgi:transaldolase/glucose-6-phosphate isomerase
MLPAPLESAVNARLAALARDRIIDRIWARDHTVWRPEPAECADRLGWLTVHQQMFARLPAIAALRETLRAEGAASLLLLGMGGSSLAPEVMASAFGPSPDALRFELLDSTDPRQLDALMARLDLAATVIAVSSKSGTTIETRSQFAFFRERLPDPHRYIVITDPGTPLEAEAHRLGIERLFLNPPDIGGRFSALSYFGLVPAILCGVDIPGMFGRLGPMARSCQDPDPAANPGAWLGAVMAEAALAGRDKLTLFLPQQVEGLGHWIEQLVAESTGKHGRGILPVEGERIGPPSVYGDDRLFVAYGPLDGLDELEASGQPVVRLPAIGPLDLAAEFFRWEFATAVAGHILGINPFDQPNVEEAKRLARRLLEGAAPEPVTPAPADILASIRPGDYLAILAYLPRDRTTADRLERARHAFRDRLRVATTIGFGPRYLHSTGQLHKGGPNTGVFLVVEDPPSVDFPVPGEPFTFAQLEAAQARGDVAALLAHGRRVARLSLAELERLAFPA